MSNTPRPAPPKLPEALDPLDLARLQTFIARADAARAKLSLLSTIQRDLQEAEQGSAQICAKYNIRQGDQIQPDGSILRGEGTSSPTAC